MDQLPKGAYTTQTYTHIFVIGDFVNFCKGIPNNTGVECGSFELAGVEWTPVFYPHGQLFSVLRSIEVDWTMVSLKRSAPVCELATVCLTVRNHIGANRRVRMGFTTSRKAGELGWEGPEGFVRLADYTKASGLVANDGSVTFEVELMIASPVAKPTLKRKAEELPVIPADAYADCWLELETGVRLPVHRRTLALKSEVFHALFQSNMAESKDGIIKLEPGTAEATARHMLAYIYDDTKPIATKRQKTDSLDDKEGCDTLALFRLADFYGIAGLAAHCVSLLESVLAKDTIGDALAMARTMKTDEASPSHHNAFREAVRRYVAANPLSLM